MASVNDIERLAALVDRLLPLASRARGEVIAADDWNTVVGALLEVARAVVGQGGESPVPPHAHLDQVTLAWLDPRLRTLIERGPLADPASTSRVGAVERGAAVLGRQLDQLSAQVRDLRVVTARQETNDLDRSSSLTVLSRTVEGLTDPREEVTALRASLDAIGNDVSAVSTFASGLGDVTPSALLNGLNRVGQLEQRLTTPTGALLDAAEFQRQLTELRTTLVTEDELTAAIKNKPARLTDADRSALLAESKVAAQRQAEERAGTLVEQLRGQLQARIDDVAQSAVVAAREATGQFRAELQTAITDQLTGLMVQSETATRGRLDAAVESAGTALHATLDQRIGQLEGSLQNQVRSAITQAQPELLSTVTAAVDSRVADLDSRLAALQSGVGELRGSLNAATTDLAALGQSTSAALANQSATLRAEIAASVRSAVDDVRTSQTTGLESLRAELAQVRQQIPPVVRGVTREELLTELAHNNDQLRSEVLHVDTGPIIFRPPLPGPG